MHGGCAGETGAGDDDGGAAAFRARRRGEPANRWCSKESERAGRGASTVRRCDADGYRAGTGALTAVICVAELTTKLAALVLPNCTAVAPVKPVPVMTTLVPPAFRAGRRGEPGHGRRWNVGEGAGRRAGAVRRGDADGYGTGAGRADRGDLRRRVDDVARARCATELHGGRAGESGAGDDDAGAAAFGPDVGARPVTVGAGM